MGTKIEFYINFNNLLGTTSPNSNNFTSSSTSTTVNGVDNWDYSDNTEHKVKKYQKTTRLGDKIHTSISRMLEKRNVDSIKKTMQIHEDIFKQQVKELHRLYSVQKMLMGEIKQSRFWNIPMTNSDHVNHSHQYLIKWENSSTQITSGANNLNFPSLRDDLNSREHSGSCSGDNVKILRGFDLERPAPEFEQNIISTGISVIDEDHQTGPSCQMTLKENNKMSIEAEFGDDIDSTHEVELTLSIGSSSLNNKRSKSKNKESIKELDSSASFKADRGGDCSDPNTPMSSSSATIFDQQAGKQPLWLFHGLKLK